MVGVVHILGLIVWLLDPPLGTPAVLGALLVELGCACRLGALLIDRRDLCVREIAEGGEQLPLAAVARERRRLSTLAHRARLAGAIERRLRDESSSVRGVALTEQLTSSPASVLYGSEFELLRRELGRASYLLSV